MAVLVSLYTRVATWLGARQWAAQGFARISVGAMFAGSGWFKLADVADYTAYFESLGIPFPAIQAPVVAAIECAAGALLAAGLATRIAAAALCGIMVVAIATARIAEAGVGGVLDFLYLNEWLLLLILVWLVFAGAGKLSVDHVLARRR